MAPTSSTQGLAVGGVGALLVRGAVADHAVDLDALSAAIEAFRHEPVALMLSRQPLPTLDRTLYAPASGVARGAYVLADPPEGDPDVILVATGS